VAASRSHAGPVGSRSYDRDVEREGRLETADGRRLAYVERGDPDGAPVVLHHGTPGSRLGTHPDPAVYRGIRLLAYDRPGYGLSDARPGRVVADAAGDVRALADHVGLDGFAVFGISGGGPHSLACAALLPERVTRAGVMVGAAPSDDPALDFTAGMADVNIKEFGAAREGEDALGAILAPWVEQSGRDPDGVLDALAAELPEYDREVVSRPELRAELRRSIVESVRQGARGWIDDDLAFATSWGFSLADVRTEVRLWQGELDVLVPRSHGDYLAERLPNATFELVPGAGHMLLDHWRETLDWLGA
jgi:pimeloyl-ACP methyl ester carboxylesterase